MRSYYPKMYCRQSHVCRNADSANWFCKVRMGRGHVANGKAYSSSFADKDEIFAAGSIPRYCIRIPMWHMLGADKFSSLGIFFTQCLPEELSRLGYGQAPKS